VGVRLNRAPLVRPEFGPSLPELLSGRLSVSRRAVTIGAVVFLVVVFFVVRALIDDGREQITVHGKPSYNLLYDPGQLHPVKPTGGEQLHLRGRRKNVAVEITARPANLPPFDGDVIGGQLPLYTAQLAERLKAELPGFVMGDEGKARINQAPGYQLAYTSGSAGNRTYWREVYVMPKADEPDQTVLLRMSQTFTGRAGPRGRALLKAAKKAYRSFRFGAHRPLFQGG
jgi:hypothetical protein